MKMPSIITTVTTIASFYFILSSSTFVSATTLRVLFNNGNAQTSSTLCNTNDNMALNETLKQVAQYALFPFRHRRTLSTIMESNLSIDQNATLSSSSSVENIGFVQPEGSLERELWPAYCADLCSGYQPRTCRTARCVGYRRNRKLKWDNGTLPGNSRIIRNSDDRTLQKTLPCYMVVERANSMIDEVNSRISDTCKVFIARSTRIIDCIYDAEYGEVKGIRARTTRSPSVELSSNVPITGWSVCKSVSALEIIAIVNECVIVVDFDLSGPTFHFFRDNTPPFSTIIPIHTAGVYSFLVRSNRSYSQEKRYTFTVNNC